MSLSKQLTILSVTGQKNILRGKRPMQARVRIHKQGCIADGISGRLEGKKQWPIYEYSQIDHKFICNNMELERIMLSEISQRGIYSML